MTNALTLTEAAERLAPVFAEETGTSTALVSSPKGKWLSLDDAASVLSERVTGKAPTERKTKKSDVTIRQAARQIDTPFADLSELRRARSAATRKQLEHHATLTDFIDRALPLFNGMDDISILSNPDFQAAYGYALGLRQPYEQACKEEDDAWKAECAAEVEAFEALRPEWSAEDSERVASMVESLGGDRTELLQLWTTPTPLNLASPICLRIAQLATGIQGQGAVTEGLASVGFSDREIQAAMAGTAPVLLRDHRIQELVARATDAHTTAKDREAA
ncbi:hypothetical protein JQ617_06995 [Bradyrhizobium sp. KB893862 SZCCT0404]|uniref:hypothetical protein n=1 Tax=Bradyrhizobium sp. KB893862 SZCCT0404 TaxID=2807672 RepID=UPI001BA7C35E|nr:hypothetical protein [Bradyrhizobium sp. KB893862 SZCCT0404]MBR1173697.1 hypothetical protein [Bradyrhizobium sp. KB893862 SZCCT0404]